MYVRFKRRSGGGLTYNYGNSTSGGGLTYNYGNSTSGGGLTYNYGNSTSGGLTYIDIGYYVWRGKYEYGRSEIDIEVDRLFKEVIGLFKEVIGLL